MGECRICGKKGFMIKLQKCDICKRTGCTNCVVSMKAMAKITKIENMEIKFLCASCSDMKARADMASQNKR